MECRYTHQPFIGMDMDIDIQQPNINQPINHAEISTIAPLEGEDQELGVVLVVEGREGDGAVVARLEPVHLHFILERCRIFDGMVVVDTRI